MFASFLPTIPSPRIIRCTTSLPPQRTEFTSWSPSSLLTLLVCWVSRFCRRFERSTWQPVNWVTPTVQLSIPSTAFPPFQRSFPSNHRNSSVDCSHQSGQSLSCSSRGHRKHVHQQVFANAGEWADRRAELLEFFKPLHVSRQAPKSCDGLHFRWII